MTTVSLRDTMVNLADGDEMSAARAAAQLAQRAWPEVEVAQALDEMSVQARAKAIARWQRLARFAGPAAEQRVELPARIQPSELSEVRALLKSAESDQRIGAAILLRSLPHAGADALPELLLLLGDERVHAASVAADTLVTLPQGVVEPALRNLMLHSDTPALLRRRAAEVQSRLPVGDALRTLAEILNSHPDAESRHGAVVALTGMGADADALLFQALDDEEFLVASAAAAGIAKRLPQDDTAFNFIAQTAEHQVSLLGQMLGYEEVFTMERLARGLADARRLVRLIMVSAVAAVGMPAASACGPVLLPWLQHQDPDHRAMAAVALGRMRYRAPDVVPALSQMMASDAEETVRTMAAMALLELGPAPQIMPFIIAALRQAPEEMQMAAAELLSYHGEDVSLLFAPPGELPPLP